MHVLHSAAFVLHFETCFSCALKQLGYVEIDIYVQLIHIVMYFYWHLDCKCVAVTKACFHAF